MVFRLIIFLFLCVIPFEFLFADVEVAQLFAVDDSYKLRYPRFTSLWSITSSPIRPSDYFRPSDGLTYSDLFGDSSISNLELSVFFRYKFSFFDFGVGPGVSQGSLASSRALNSSLGVNITTLKLRAWLNTISNEPFFVPFFGSEYLNIKASESDGVSTLVTQLPGAWIYRVGFQIQVNDIDSTGARQALVDVGLQNTFIELSYFGLLSKTGELFLTPLSGLSVGLSLEF